MTKVTHLVRGTPSSLQIIHHLLIPVLQHISRLPHQRRPLVDLLQLPLRHARFPELVRMRSDAHRTCGYLDLVGRCAGGDAEGFVVVW